MGNGIDVSPSAIAVIMQSDRNSMVRFGFQVAECIGELNLTILKINGIASELPVAWP
jgi:hypothetical protein